mmetsp:Transcript_18510/g.38924  ORF Transcript_18510/g.38924 Transcript_18510/m.38924 type:complete len:524 (+) Transcript_18510:1811-3382(+)
MTEPDKEPSVELILNMSVEEDAESSDDENEAMTIAELASESSLKILWDYYLKPTTRENEELPGGMRLRKKRVNCNLLRYKNSDFRQKLHAKILRLKRLGKKEEIRRLLKAMYDHDESMQSGDGPSQLIEEILGQQSNNNEIEVLDYHAVAAMQEHEQENATERRPTEECHENDTPKDLGEISHHDVDGSKHSTCLGTTWKVAKQSENPESYQNRPSEMRREVKGEGVDQVFTTSELEQKPGHTVQNVTQELVGAKASEDSVIASEVIRGLKSTNGAPRKFSSSDNADERDMGQKAVDLHDAQFEDKPSHHNEKKVAGGGSIVSSDTNGDVDNGEMDQFSLAKDDIPSNLSDTDDSVEILNHCSDAAFNWAELDQRPSHQQDVRNVLQEWSSEETCSSAAPSVRNGNLEKNPKGRSQIPQDDTAASNHESSDDSSKMRPGFIDLCDDEDHVCAEVAQKQNGETVMGGGGRKRTQKDAADIISLINNDKEGNQSLTEEDFIDLTQEMESIEHQQQPKVIDLSQED